jgi:hypothetical protein
MVGGDSIYPHRPDLKEKKFWKCIPCNAYVGCHPGTSTPLGNLANAELRRARNIVHSVFDPLWKGRKMTRSAAYQWLASQLDIPVEKCHIAMFDISQCRSAWRACQSRQK